jgi:small-conductance mechanosensitive channel
VTFDRAHFSGMAASSLNFDVVYWVETADFNRYMDIQQEIYLQIMDRFAALAIEFAFPTQTLHLHDMRAPTGTDAAA